MSCSNDCFLFLIRVFHKMLALLISPNFLTASHACYQPRFSCREGKQPLRDTNVRAAASSPDLQGMSACTTLHEAVVLVIFCTLGKRSITSPAFSTMWPGAHQDAVAFRCAARIRCKISLVQPVFRIGLCKGPTMAPLRKIRRISSDRIASRGYDFLHFSYLVWSRKRSVQNKLLISLLVGLNVGSPHSSLSE